MYSYISSIMSQGEKRKYIHKFNFIIHYLIFKLQHIKIDKVYINKRKYSPASS